MNSLLLNSFDFDCESKFEISCLTSVGLVTFVDADNKVEDELRLGCLN